MAEYFRRGVSEMWFTTTLTAPAAPSRAEVVGANGDDFTAAVADIAGWDFSNAPITTPKLSTTFDTSIVGPDTAGGPEITVYDNDTATTLRDAVAKGTTGFMVLAPYGLTVGKQVDVYTVTSTGVNDEWTLGAEAAKFKAQFAVNAAPNQHVTLAA